MSKIEWTDGKTPSWNPVTGCSKVSDGCTNCYAEELSLRRGWSALPWTKNNALDNVIMHPERLKQPLSWRGSRRVFVNSMSDLFHEQIPFEFLDLIVEVMAARPQHTFIVLTKRPERILDYLAWQTTRPGIEGFTANVWIGVSIEDVRVLGRVDTLRVVPSAIRWISAEPLIGPLVGDELDEDELTELCDAGCGAWAETAVGVGGRLLCGRCAAPYQLDLTGIDLLVVGGESGKDHRPIETHWVTNLRDRAVDEGVPFFFKQWGGIHAKAGGRLLEGRTWDELPAPAVGQGQLELDTTTQAA